MWADDPHKRGNKTSKQALGNVQSHNQIKNKE